MCSIFGALATGASSRPLFNETLNCLVHDSHQRGRDGRGFALVMRGFDTETLQDVRRDDGESWTERDYLGDRAADACLIGNTRAEPTTEYVATKRPDDQQPYSSGGWHIVHNGTIANDKDLRDVRLVDTDIDSAAIVELLSWQCPPGAARTAAEYYSHFYDVIQKLEGSFAILAVHDQAPGVLFAACNYRPIWYASNDGGTFIGSSRDYLPRPSTMLAPYSVAMFRADNRHPYVETLRAPQDKRSLVICSGGLDSVVAATAVKRRGDLAGLIHFQYGSRAEGPEVEAVKAVAEALGVPLTLFPLNIYDPTDSPLLRADSAIAGGEAGAEFAHEWVPARNLVMLSVATAFAEAKGFNNIVLGNNLEEAGAYPDNEPEFIARFADLLPFAVGANKRMTVEMPVGNLMKHEIVALGHKLRAPLDLTWSCYRAGAKHCGTCGPCFMRRTAFRINDLPEVIPYLDEEPS